MNIPCKPSSNFIKGISHCFEVVYHIVREAILCSMYKI